jgi:citrate synthase
MAQGEKLMVEYRTGLGTSDRDHIKLLGMDLAGDLMGQVGFGELAFWMVAKRRPSAAEVRVFETVLVALADHGFTPTVIAARMTLYSAPESLQGAVAAGLLGGGSRFLGVTEDTGKFLNSALAEEGLSIDSKLTEDEWDAVARNVINRAREQGGKIPGLGHPIHKDGDPRTPVMFRIASEAGMKRGHLSLYEAIGRVHHEILGKTLPLNGAGVSGAALADLGLPPHTLRGFALLARTAGLIGHLLEELEDPAAPDIYMSVDGNTKYVPPAK